MDTFEFANNNIYIVFYNIYSFIFEILDILMKTREVWIYDPIKFAKVKRGCVSIYQFLFPISWNLNHFREGIISAYRRFDHFNILLVDYDSINECQ